MSQWMANLVTLIALGLGLWLFLSLRKQPSAPEVKKAAPIAPSAPAVQAAPIAPKEDEEELLAVLTAAIHSYTQNNQAIILAVRNKSQRWQNAGLQNQMQSRRQ